MGIRVWCIRLHSLLTGAPFFWAAGTCRRTFRVGRTGKLELWDVAAGALLHTFEGHLKSVAFSPDGGDGKMVKLRDVESGKLVRTFELRFTPPRARCRDPR
jgi:hypothetical protein